MRFQKNTLVLALPVIGLAGFLLWSQGPAKTPPPKKDAMTAKVQTFEKRLARWLKEEQWQKDLTLSQPQEQELLFSFKGPFCFEKNAANLKNTCQAFLKQLSSKLKGTPFEVQIQVQVDHLPKNKKDVFPTEWEYASVRGTRIVRFLKQELPQKKMVAMAWQTDKNQDQVALRLIVPKSQPQKKKESSP